MSITVRNVAKDEAERAAAIERECLKTAWTEKQITELPENAVYLVAFDGEEMCGIASMYCLLDEGQIMNVAVSEKFRRKGIANSLMNRLLERAKEKNCKTVTLEVAENNKSAVALYEKLGFFTVGKRKGFYGDADAILMDKTI